MPTRRGLTLAATAGVFALVGLSFGVEEFVLAAVTVGALILAAAAGLLWQVLGSRGALHGRLGPVPPEVAVGDELDTVLVVANGGSRIVTVGCVGAQRWRLSHPGLSRLPPPSIRRHARPRGRLRGALGRLPSGTTATLVAPGGRWETSLAVPTDARGVLSLEPVVVWCTSFAGLLCWPLRCPAAARVVVLPRPSALSLGTSRPPAPRVADGPVPADHGGPGGDEFEGLRPYVAGDRLSRLHWPAAAQGGPMLVRHFVEMPPSVLELVVDTRPWKIEESVCEAAALGLAELGRGGTVSVHTAEGDGLVVAPGPQARLGLLRGLAVVAPSTQHRSPVLRALATTTRARP